jgi:hypothetical protein
MKDLIDALANLDGSIPLKGLSSSSLEVSGKHVGLALKENILNLMFMDQVPIADIGGMTTFTAPASIIKLKQAVSEKEKTKG